MSSHKSEVVHRYSKYVKTIRNRIVEVEFKWFQTNPNQSFQLRLNEEKFRVAQQNVRSKKLMSMPFEQFVLLIDPILSSETSEINSAVLRSTFDSLFDQNANGNVEKDEFESLFVLLNASTENLRQIYPSRSNFISFQEFSTFVKHGYLRELLMIN